MKRSSQLYNFGTSRRSYALVAQTHTKDRYMLKLRRLQQCSCLPEIHLIV